jgi:putative PEP-CTERM system histidine kinase
MSIELAVHAAAALVAGGLALRAAGRHRPIVEWAFGAAMMALALEAALAALGATDGWTARAEWQRRRLLVTSLVPGFWLVFALTFGRSDHRRFLRRWAWMVVAVFLLPLGLGVRAWPADAVAPIGERLVIPLAGAGFAFQLAYLVGLVLVLANLERTLRSSTGSMRWFIKYMVLGVGALMAARIYTSSQALLFRSMDTSLQLFESFALLTASLLIAVSLIRVRLRDADVYVSQNVLYNSATVVVVGAYLLVVGVLARVVQYLGGPSALPAATLVAFLALLGLAVLALSDRLRERVQQFVNRNFRRPQYDYRREWAAFTMATSTLVDRKALCAAVAARVSETLRVPSVTVWIYDEAGTRLALGGSTIYSDSEAGSWLATHGHALIEVMAKAGAGPVDLDTLPEGGSRLGPSATVRYAVPLSAGGEPVGIMAVGARGDGGALNAEDLDLLKTLADQAAGNILGLRLSEGRLKAKEMEAFQNLSAFFVHDLKNLASKLSLTLQNLPAHYDDPEFRTDLLATMKRSVAKIDDMCRRLSPLSRTLQLKRTPGDLREVVRSALSELNGSLHAELLCELSSTRAAVIDPEQMQKVVLNLVLNANDAVGADGTIVVTTGERDQWVYLSVADDGCGMSQDFIARSLFKPFRTTKAHGLGIGLFHAKSIVEAHRGRIEVDSEEGQGTTFRVLLPGGPP